MDFKEKIQNGTNTNEHKYNMFKTTTYVYLRSKPFIDPANVICIVPRNSNVKCSESDYNSDKDYINCEYSSDNVVFKGYISKNFICKD